MTETLPKQAPPFNIFDCQTPRVSRFFRGRHKDDGSYFPTGWYDGTITKVMSSNGLYRVVYDADGDLEDLTQKAALDAVGFYYHPETRPSGMMRESEDDDDDDETESKPAARNGLRKKKKKKTLKVTPDKTSSKIIKLESSSVKLVQTLMKQFSAVDDEKSLDDSEEERRMCLPPPGYDREKEVYAKGQGDDGKGKGNDKEHGVNVSKCVTKSQRRAAKRPAAATAAAHDRSDGPRRRHGSPAAAIIKPPPAARRTAAERPVPAQEADEHHHADGWIRFHAVMTETNLPVNLQNVLHLMDVFFPNQSYHDKLWTNASHTNNQGTTSKPGIQTRSKLRQLKAELHPGVSWHGHKQEWAPRTKDDLEAFMRVLMELGNEGDHA